MAEVCSPLPAADLVAIARAGVNVLQAGAGARREDAARLAVAAAQTTNAAKLGIGALPISCVVQIHTLGATGGDVVKSGMNAAKEGDAVNLAGAAIRTLSPGVEGVVKVGDALGGRVVHR
ncbi:hypothetical protein FRC12_003376 [Ceratobasidium sp. 428]|nr:hypothetical protein FRC12_003376 [Ceratobasidium sp. 428]